MITVITLLQVAFPRVFLFRDKSMTLNTVHNLGLLVIISVLDC